MRYLGYVVHALVGAGLLLACAAPWIDPRAFWPAALAGLAFPALWLANAGFALGWLLLRRWKALAVALLLVLPTLPALPRYGRWPSAEGRDAAKVLDRTDWPVQPLRVLSWNVRVFNKNDGRGRFHDRDAMLDLMADAVPDVLALQEYFSVPDGGAEDHERLIRRRTGLPHSAVWEAIRDRNGRQWGLALFSRYPILERGTVTFPGSLLNGAQWADLDAPGGRVRVFNVHLQSIQLSRDVYAVEAAVQDLRDADTRRATLRKFRDAYRRRAEQADLVAEAMAASPWPVLLCGDFNDPPQSYAYRRVHGRLRDAFAVSGSGLARTHATLPAVRIDYVMADTAWAVLDYRTERVDHSDHYPLVVELLPPAP